MSQHDLVIANGSGAVVRADINDALQALGTLSSGNNAPATIYPYQLWADTSTNVIKIRNSSNTDWLTLGDIADYFGYEFMPATTKMLFYQDAAPSGWHIENTLDDKVIYVTKGSAAGGQTGGGAHNTGSWTQSNHTHNHSVPNHKHEIPIGPIPNEIGISSSHPWGSGNNFASAARMTGASYVSDYAYPLTNNPYTGSSNGTTDGNATANTWRPAAYCCIICEKD